MSAILTVARREINERRLVLAAGAATGVLATLAPLLPVWSAWEARELILATSGTLAAILGVALAVLLGGSMLSRELADGRLGFYLSRPITPVALWAGKMLAAFGLSFTAALLAAVPALAVLLGAPGGAGELWRLLPLALGLPTLVMVTAVAVAHAVSVMARSRSSWLLADLTAAVVLLSAALWLGGVLASLGARATLRWAAWSTIAVCALAVLLAGAVATSVGRWSVGTTHRALSLTLWAGVAAAVAGLGAWTAWVVSAGPADIIRVVDVQPAPRGTWVAVGGEVGMRGDYLPQFLVELASGRSLRTTAHVNSSVAFSGDGSRAAWLVRETDERGKVYRLFLADLSADRPRREATSVLLDGAAASETEITLDRSGSRAVLIDSHNVQVIELPAGGQIGAARLPIEEARWTASLIGSRIELVAYTRGWPVGDTDLAPGTLALYDYDPSRRHLEQRWALDLEPHLRWAHYLVDREHDRLLLAVRSAQRRVVSLVQVSTGMAVATLHEDPRGLSGRFLADGRIVVAGGDGATSACLVYSPSGELLRRLELPSNRWTIFGSEVAPGRLIGSVAREVPGEAGWTRCGVLIDVDAGTVRELGEGLAPAVGWWLTPSWRPEVGSLGSTLMISGADTLVRLEPETGTVAPVLAGTRSHR